MGQFVPTYRQSDREVDGLISFGNGTELTKKTIDLALAAIGTTTKATLSLGPGIWTITDDADYSAYSNVNFNLPNGSVLDISATKTLTLPGPANMIAQPSQQIFSGAGAVRFSKHGTDYPEWWGIDGADDEVQINQAFTALTAGGTVALLAELYTVTTPIIPATKTILTISPRTTIRLDDGANENVIRIEFDEVTVEGGGKIDGNGANQTASSSGIRMVSSRLKVKDLTIIDCWWAGIISEGMIHFHMTDTLIQNCEISGCNDNGIRIGNWTDRVKIRDCYIHDNGLVDTGGNRRGISTLQFVHDLIIEGNTVTRSYENGIFIWTDCVGVRILNNYVHSNGHFGIETSAEGAIIEGNIVIGNGGLTEDDGGIFPFSKNIVKSNFIDGNEHHGIYIYQQTGVIVAENIVRNTNDSGIGIRFYDPTNCLAVGNVVFDDQDPVTQEYGIMISTVEGVTGTPLVGNVVFGNTYNYLYGVSAETPMVGNIHSASGYELGGQDRKNFYSATISDTQTFDAAFFNTLFLNGGEGDRNVNPSGTFRAGADVWIKNTGSTNDLIFDSAGLAQTLAPDEIGYFKYSGSAWVKMYVGS